MKKKTLAMLLMVNMIFVILLTGCGVQEADGTAEDTTQNPSKQEEIGDNGIEKGTEGIEETSNSENVADKKADEDPEKKVLVKEIIYRHEADGSITERVCRELEYDSAENLTKRIEYEDGSTANREEYVVSQIKRAII